METGSRLNVRQTEYLLKLDSHTRYSIEEKNGPFQKSAECLDNLLKIGSAVCVFTPSAHATFLAVNKVCSNKSFCRK